MQICVEQLGEERAESSFGLGYYVDVNTWFKRQCDRAMLEVSIDYKSVAILQTYTFQNFSSFLSGSNGGRPSR